MSDHDDGGAPSRRVALATLGAVAASVFPACRTTPVASSTATRMPTAFVAHGAPTLALDRAKGKPLRAWGAALPRPRALLVLSAHWTRSPVTLEASSRPRIVYDFQGFPDPLYRVTYDAIGAPDLMPRVAGLLESFGPVAQVERGRDHGTWVPLVHMFPAHDVPILQVSLPIAAGPSRLLAFGRALTPLRDEGVLVLGSGNVVHNLGEVDFADAQATPGWASDFDAFVKDALVRGDLDALADHRQKAKASLRAHPTDEHLLPLLPIAAAASGGAVRFALEGFEYGTISRRCVQLG